MGATVQRRGGSYRVAVHHGGTRQYQTVRNKKDAEALAQLVRRQELAGMNVVEAIEKARRVTPTVTYPLLKDALPRWVDGQVAAGDLRHATGKLYKKGCATWLYPALGDVPVNQLTREQLGGIVRTIKEAGRSMATVDQVRNPVRGLLQSLIETKQIAGPNAAGDLKYFVGKVQTKQTIMPKYFTTDEAPGLMAAVQALYPRWHKFILTGLLGGLRWGESAGLYVSDIDWRRGRLHVQRIVSEGGRLEETSKNHRTRHVKASAELLRALTAQVEAVGLEAGVKGWSPAQRMLVFPNSRGKVRSYTHFLESVWQPLLAKTGLPYRKYHATRHTYATWLLEGGADLRWVSNQLGHASIAQTADTYGHVAPERHEGAVEALDQIVVASTTR